MNRQNNIVYNYSSPIFIGSILVVFVLTIILTFVSYILIIKDFYVIIIVFIWLLYGLLFRDIVPKIIRTGRNILSNTPALILTEEMLIDNINRKQLKWNEIKGIEEYYDVRTGRYIAISVKNPHKYLNKEKSFFDRTIMRFNEKYWNGVFAIRPQQIKCKKQELLKTLKTYLVSNKTQKD